VTSNLYILVGRTPVKVDDFVEWSLWFDTADTRVARTEFDDCYVSTVFLGIEHPGGYLFETMIFGGEHDCFQQRYFTWEAAVVGHQEIVDMVLDSIGGQRAVEEVVQSLLDEFNKPKL
jgi:hypothetical protein